jgi:hypothetical protein
MDCAGRRPRREPAAGEHVEYQPDPKREASSADEDLCGLKGKASIAVLSGAPTGANTRTLWHECMIAMQNESEYAQKP